jgi:hypothetical protein
VSANHQDLLPVPFRETTLFLADLDGVPYVPMRPVVEGMGLDWKSQHVKLTQNPRFSSVVEITTQLPGDTQRRAVTCIPLRKLPGWLMSISPNKVKPEIRDTVIAYQNECDDALWAYWSQGHAANPRQPPISYADSLRLLADEVERREQAERELQASRPKVAFHDQVVNAETLLDFAQAFNLLHGRTGQSFTRRTFLAFLRRHGIACQPNPYNGIGAERFVPRTDYNGPWFVSELTPAGTVEWLIRPIAIAGIVALIEQDRLATPLPITRRLSAPTAH